MKAGVLNKRIIIESPTDTVGIDGGVVTVFNSLATLWASVEPQGGTETSINNMIMAGTDTTIKIRFNKNLAITEKCRVLYRGIIYNIISILNNSMGNDYMVLNCKSGTNNG